jgi:hypothetical protein
MRLLPIAVLLALVALPAGSGAALAQLSPAEGNWACKANIDGKKAGILTIFAGSYGYASATYGSKASGTGNVQLATDGATFLDGNLLIAAGIATALNSIDTASGQDMLTLYQPQADGTAMKPILTCTVR